MRQNQAVWRGLRLQGRIKAAPMIKPGPVRQNQVAPGNEIQVKRAHAPAPLSFAAEFHFDRQKMGKDALCSHACRDKDRCRRIHVIRAGFGGKTGG